MQQRRPHTATHRSARLRFAPASSAASAWEVSRALLPGRRERTAGERRHDPQRGVGRRAGRSRGSKQARGCGGAEARRRAWLVAALTTTRTRLTRSAHTSSECHQRLTDAGFGSQPGCGTDTAVAAASIGTASRSSRRCSRSYSPIGTASAAPRPDAIAFSWTSPGRITMAVAVAVSMTGVTGGRRVGSAPRSARRPRRPRLLLFQHTRPRPTPQAQMHTVQTCRTATRHNRRQYRMSAQQTDAPPTKYNDGVEYGEREQQCHTRTPHPLAH